MCFSDSGHLKRDDSSESRGGLWIPMGHLARWVASWQLICFPRDFGWIEIFTVYVACCILQSSHPHATEPTAGLRFLSVWWSVDSYGPSC
ncbi:hypothetical protein AVEN_15091-1 [Araneus ventricosus]|uniref:Uncharacterized protein n=1 Tax=Araneus ventricosus TaxID=182803 RepID=A0A4Y2QBN8_ARAVE|nr:hypothetical protein AVEN_15091-1 [Araneus ventricosus]